MSCPRAMDPLMSPVDFCRGVLQQWDPLEIPAVQKLAVETYGTVSQQMCEGRQIHANDSTIIDHLLKIRRHSFEIGST